MKTKLGSKYEKVAAKYLESKNYAISCLNWTCHWGELDVIASKNKEIVFVEVKYRSSTKYGYGYESINYFKKKHLSRAIQIYLKRNKLENENWRFDVINIVRVRGSLRLFHYQAVQLW